MSDITTLKTAIIEQAHQEGKLKLDEAKAQLDKDFEARKAQLLHEKEAERVSRLKELTQKFQIEVQQICNQERQSTLVSKQMVLKELFAAAEEAMTVWNVEEELTFVKSVLSKYSSQEIVLTFGQVTKNKLTAVDLKGLQTEFPLVKFTDTVIEGEAGFVISVGHVDDTYLYADLIESIYNEESSRIAAVIFTEK